jgi:hypothetical protein
LGFASVDFLSSTAVLLAKLAENSDFIGFVEVNGNVITVSRVDGVYVAPFIMGAVCTYFDLIPHFFVPASVICFFGYVGKAYFLSMALLLLTTFFLNAIRVVVAFFSNIYGLSWFVFHDVPDYLMWYAVFAAIWHLHFLKCKFNVEEMGP